MLILCFWVGLRFVLFDCLVGYYGCCVCICLWYCLWFGWLVGWLVVWLCWLLTSLIVVVLVDLCLFCWL